MSLHTLMFGWEFPPRHSGGLGIACEGLVKGLQKQGVTVTLVLPTPVDAPGVDVRYPTTEHFSSVRVPSMLDPYDNAQSYEERMRVWHTAHEPLVDLYGPDLGAAVHSYTELAVQMTKDVKPDVIHCHDWMTYEAGLRAGAHHGVPVVAHVHATELDRTDFKPNEWIARRERESLLRCDRVIAVSAYTKNMLMTHYGIPGDRISVVHNGHDQPAIHVAPTLMSKRPGTSKQPLVLFLGRLTVQKNPWQFLEIAARVHEHRPEVQFVMAGDGPMLTTLIDRSCELGLAENVIFTGKLSRRETQAIFTEADCFVMPSLSEPFGLVALEAIAHRTPVIVSRQSGVAEVLDHAFKVDYWDADLMSDCILTILREEPLAEQLKSEAPRVLSRLTWKNQAGSVQSIYRDLIQS